MGFFTCDYIKYFVFLGINKKTKVRNYVRFYNRPTNR